jgi:hypothetical protein
MHLDEQPGRADSSQKLVPIQPQEGMMSDSSSGADASQSNPAGKSAGSGAIAVDWKTVVLITIVMGSIIAIALPIAFHYAKASDATSVLGVILPVFTAILGAALGTGVGSAAGASGKKAVENQLTQTHQALQSVSRELPDLSAKVATVFSQVKTGLQSPAGEAQFLMAPVAGATTTPAPIDIASMDDANASIARIQATIDSAKMIG